MAGGDETNIANVQPIFDALKPEGEFGWVHAGKVGAGHFSKMVHNGIEYAIMQAYAEGWELLQAVDEVDNVTEVFRSWREGTVDPVLAARPARRRARRRRTSSTGIAGYAEDSGEGRWTVEAGIDHAVATAGDHRRALRPVRLPPGRQPGDEGGRRDAQPVRRPRRRKASAPPGTTPRRLRS